LKSLSKLFFAVLLSIVVGAGFPAMAAPGLGISVSFERADQTDAEVTGRIWAGGEQGSKLTRTILVRSLSDDVTQEISFAIHDQILVNAELTTDYDVPSRISNWVTFSPEKPLLRPGGEVRITMTIEIPSNAADEAFEATLRVLSGAVENLEEIEEGEDGVKAVVGTRLAIDSGMWLGVGDALELMPNFEIIGVDGVLLEGTKYVRVFFENTGLVPLRLTGRLQLADASFADLVYEPQDFIVPQIRTNEDGYVDVSVQPEIEDGNYRSFVIAQHGGVRKTEIFEGELVFDDPSLITLPDFLLRGALLVAALGALVFGYRMIRSSTKGGNKNPPPIGTANPKPVGTRNPTPIGGESTALMANGNTVLIVNEDTKPPLGASLSASARKQGLLALGVLSSLQRGTTRTFKKLIDSGKALWDSRSSRVPGPDLDPKPGLVAKISASAKKQSSSALRVLASLQRGTTRAFKKLIESGKAYLDSRSRTEPRPELEPRPRLGFKLPTIPAWPFTKTRKINATSDTSATEIVPAAPSQARLTPVLPYSTSRPTSTTPRPASSDPRPLYPYWYQPPKKEN
jgi:hypothetical protein